MQFSHYIPTRIHFGPGALEKIGNGPLPGKKALVVISSGTAMRRTGILDRVLALLKKAGTEAVVFDKIRPNPVKGHVMEGAALAVREGCDFVVGLGGGSSMDSAKSIALMAKNPGDYWDYVRGGTGGGKPCLGGALPIVAITTTAGTGTEADPWTVITKEETSEKIGIGNDHTFPTLSIVDPELMLSVPPFLTACQGFDALCHAVEGYLSSAASPMSDLYALKSIELVARWLPVAVAEGGNLEARGHVAFANTLSGMVETLAGCTSEHALEHPMSAFHPELPHGAGLVMLSRAYHAFFAGHVPQLYADMAKAMGAADFQEALDGLIKACGLDGLKMSDWGITRDELPSMVPNAQSTMGRLFEHDRYQLSSEEALGILERAFR
ncbi:MAG: iron-containing alcohol dehydrogenase [Desulfovibrio sp.]|jgi:alcohol dehydrogenase